MLVDGWHLYPEQFRQGLLGQPDSFAPEEDFDLNGPFFGGVEEEFALLAHNTFAALN